MVMVMVHMAMMGIIPPTSHASSHDQYLAHRVSSHTKGCRIQPDTSRSSITPRMASILGGDHRKPCYNFFLCLAGSQFWFYVGMQVFLCKTHPYGRLEACWDWGPGGPGTGDLLTNLLNVIFIHTSECLWLQFNVLSFLWRFNAQVSELVANLTSSEWLDNTRAKISDTKTVHTINIITINIIS